MVSADVYRRYKERKDKSIEEEEEKGTHVLLDEIARMRGYKEKLLGKRKIRPIVQYIDYLLEKRYQLKLIKKGEKYFDRNTEEYRIAEKNIYPIEQFVELLNRQKLLAIQSNIKYEEFVSRKEGYKSLREKEERKAMELGLSVDEYHEYLAKKNGFDSYPDYQKYLDVTYAIRGTYALLIPQKDFDDVFKLIEDKWAIGHEKFIVFCAEFWKDSLEPYFEKTKKDEAIVFTEDITRELDIFHRSKTGSLNIYNTDDLIIGLSHCMDERHINVILSKDEKIVTFKRTVI